MGYLRVDIDVDIDDIIDSMSRSDKKIIFKKLTDKDLLDELKDRGVQNAKSVEVNQFILLNNYKKRELLIQALDLPSYADDSQIIEAVKNNI